MELNLKVSIRLLVLSFWLVVSCYTAPEEEDVVITNDSGNENSSNKGISLEKTVPVKINFLGVENENDNSEDAQSMKYQSLSNDNHLLNNGLIRYTQVLEDGSGAVEVEEIIDYPENKEYLASLDKKSTFAVNNTSLPDGTMYKILAYKKEGGTYSFDKQQSFVVGSKPQIELNADQNYTLIVVSMGSRIVPKVVGENDFNSVRFVVNQSDTNTQILYQRIDNFIPNGNIADNNVDVKLKSKTTSVRIILDSSDIMGGGVVNSGRRITFVDDAKISYKRPKNVEFRLSDASQMTTAEDKQVNVLVDSFGAVNKMFVSSAYINNVIVNKTTEPVFSVIFKTDSPKEKKINIALKGFKNGARQTFRIKLRGCGIYLGPNKTNWKHFMCHNLGADYIRDPFTPSEKIHGDKYQWGMKRPIVKQEDDVYEAPRKAGWNRNSAYNTWNIGEDDPCPDGWRIPTSSEWASALNNNKGIKLGNWNARTLKVDNAGVGIGVNLMLPAAGKRFEYGNTINVDHVGYSHATMVAVWASSDSDDRAFAAIVFKDKSNREQYEVTRDYKKLDALPVRCMKKD